MFWTSKNNDIIDVGGARGSATITPADADLVKPARAIYIGVAGAVKLTFLDGTVDTYPSLVGQFAWQVVRIWLTGTTASDIHVLY